MISMIYGCYWTKKISANSLDISDFYIISMLYGHCRPRYPSRVWIYLISIWYPWSTDAKELRKYPPIVWIYLISIWYPWSTDVTELRKYPPIVWIYLISIWYPWSTDTAELRRYPSRVWLWKIHLQCHI